MKKILNFKLFEYNSGNTGKNKQEESKPITVSNMTLHDKKLKKFDRFAKNINTLKVGDKVNHKKYGIGTIIEIDKDNNNLMLINFQDGEKLISYNDKIFLDNNIISNIPNIQKPIIPKKIKMLVDRERKIKKTNNFREHPDNYRKQIPEEKITVKPGDKVYNKAFGEGEVIDTDGNNANIKFNRGIKKMSLNPNFLTKI